MVSPSETYTLETRCLWQNVNDIYLIMIVKDESHIIADTLRNIVKYIPIKSFLICDTGSTDDTINVILNTTEEIGVCGVVLNHKWKDFGHNRSLALEEARLRLPLTNHNGHDSYVLMFDADDAFEFENKHNGKINFPVPMTADAYNLHFHTPTFSYYRPLLIRIASSWTYKGVLHEYLEDTSENKSNTIHNIQGNYNVVSGRCGNRNNDPEKYLKDATMLEQIIKDYEDEPNNEGTLVSRYAFYCAQSWKDYGDNEKAIKWYCDVINKYNNWSEEKYYASIKVGELLCDEEAVYYFLKSSSFNPKRYEGTVEAAKIFLERRDYRTAHNILLPIAETIISRRTIDTTWLFCKPITYEYDALLRLLLSSYYCDDISLLKRSLLEMLKRISLFSTNCKCPQIYYSHFDAFMSGLTFYLSKLIAPQVMLSLNELMELFPLLKNALVTLSMIYGTETAHNFRNHFDDVFTYLSTVVYYTSSCWIRNAYIHLHPLLQCNGLDKRQNDVVLTMTTCKRIDLFTKTMNSILECFSVEDWSRVKQWYIIDDGSSKDDIEKMIELFPFITMISKCEPACGHMIPTYPKGHRGSMNYIFDLLAKEKPKYWLHIEDDWLFLKKDRYIDRAISCLESPSSQLQCIKQIVFNKGYGETLGDIIVPAGRSIDCEDNNDILLHISTTDEHEDDKIIQTNIPNCNYWKHFSFRPGVTVVDAILELGNFDSPNTFFEADYAEKYTQKGYKTAYFNDITSIHIGKLSGSRGMSQEGVENAYEMNGTSQF